MRAEFLALAEFHVLCEKLRDVSEKESIVIAFIEASSKIGLKKVYTFPYAKLSRLSMKVQCKRILCGNSTLTAML